MPPKRGARCVITVELEAGLDRRSGPVRVELGGQVEDGPLAHGTGVLFLQWFGEIRPPCGDPVEIFDEALEQALAGIIWS